MSNKIDRDYADAQLNYLAQLEDPAVIEQIEQIRSAVAIILPHQRLSTIDRHFTRLSNSTPSRQIASSSTDDEIVRICYDIN